MEIGIQLLAPLLTGSSVSLCADNRLVRIVRADHTSVFDVSCTPVKELKREPQNVSFAEWLDVPKDSDYRGLLARFEIKLSEFDENHLRYIRRGLHYSTNLDIGAIDVPGVGESRQVQAVMSYVLREASGRAWLLGFVDLAPPSRLDKDEGVVAVLDILGFSALMRSESLDEVEFKVRNGILAMLSVIRSTSGGVVLFEKHGDLDLSDDIALVSSGVISDTIILYPNRQSHAEPVTLLCEAVSHVMSFGLQLGWLLRGAISIGSFRAIPDEAIYLGTAIVSAHDLETAQEWSGCALSRELVERFPQEIAALPRKRSDCPVYAANEGIVAH